jgi:hypothetical protein
MGLSRMAQNIDASPLVEDKPRMKNEITPGGNFYRHGQLVEVKSEAEIRATLDAGGSLDGLPFMPEMTRFCGGRYRVYRRANKTCVEGHGLRRMDDTVLLEDARCDGAFHDGCERGCLIFWKVAWLKPVEGGAAAARDGQPASAQAWANEFRPTRNGRYYCQSTELAKATFSDLQPTHLIQDIVHGELAPKRLIEILGRAILNKVRRLFGRQRIGILTGSGKRTEVGALGLVPGDLVEVRSASEISQTLDPRGKNNGLSFEPDMTPLTGKQFRVAGPVRRIILEETGRMVKLKSTVTLEGVKCEGFCAQNCPRANPLFWRESWLKRVDGRDPRAVAANSTMPERTPH